MVKKELLYTKDHEWVRLEDKLAYVGITDYAQHSLGSIVYAEAPEVDEEISKDEPFGVVESVKAASDIYMPLSGRIAEVNEEVLDNPELINNAPYDNHIIVVELSNEEELKELLTPEQYEEFIAEE